jgi:uncharacterized membrane protein YjjP (DUF1212 family)
VSEGDSAAKIDLTLTAAGVLFSHGQMTDQVIEAGNRLGRSLGLTGSLSARWGALTWRHGPSWGPAITRAGTYPTGINMARVAATMRAVSDIESGTLGLQQAPGVLATAASRPSTSDLAFVLAAVAGALALAVIFGVQHLPAAVLIVLSTGCGAWLRRALGRHTTSVLIQPFAAALLAGIVGAAAVRLGLSSSLRLVAVCPCMVLVPGPHLLNGMGDLVKGRWSLGCTRLGFAGLIILAILVGLLAGLSLLGARLVPDPTGVGTALLTDMLAAGLAILGYSLLFTTPTRMVGWPIAVGMTAHAFRWFLLEQGVSTAMAAFGACLVAGLILTPVCRRYHMPFAAVGFAAVVSMIPGVYLFRMADSALAMLEGAYNAIDFAVLATNGRVALEIIVGMGAGLLLPKVLIDRVVP